MASGQADSSSAPSDESAVTFNIKGSTDQKIVFTLPLTTSVADIKTKLSAPEYADAPVERIRLIYSGRVLKDTDTLAVSKIKDGHTVHMVKSAASNARQNPANQGGAATPASTTSAASAGTPDPAAHVPNNFATGTGNNPLAGLTGARYAGFHGLPNASMFGADGGMGAPATGDDILRMMEDPNFVSQMSEMMNNPDVIRMMESNPMIQSNPFMRDIIRNPEMRRLMFDPNMLRMQMQMQRAMGGGSGGAQSSFPMPGATDTTPANQQPGSETRDGAAAGQTGAQAQPANPFGSMFGGAGVGAGAGQANPFAALFGQPPASPQSATSPGTNPAGQQQNSMAGLMQAMQMAQAMGGGQGGQTGANPFASLLGAGMGGFGAAESGPPDNRPPEERYAEQLRQLNDMGFFDFDRNVTALRRTGGSVQGAIEYLLGNS